MYMPNRPLPKSIPDNFMAVQVAFLGANIIWGAATAVIKYTLGYIPPFTFLYLRFMIVCLVVLPLVALQLKKEPIHKSDYLNFFLLGLFSQTSLILPFVALKFTSALDYTIIGVMASVLTVYAGHYFYHDKINKGITAGVVLASLGTILIVLEPILWGNDGGGRAAERILGNVLGLFYAMTWVVYVIWAKFSMGGKSHSLKKTLSFIKIKPMTRKYSAGTIVLTSFYVGLITLIPLAVFENLGLAGESNFDILSIDIKGVLGLLYMALFSSIVAYWLNEWGLENAKVSDFAIFGYLAPVFTLPFAYLILGELPNTLMLIGTAFIAAGVVIAEKNNSSGL
ncbi:MAG: Transmembrane protein [candidate division WWE3 bacterium GW2011_GWF2_41_45]|uniref:EamA domain-containing protein n=2 Tax=Katanobacteria TaxID=422282 RepID=A0A1F4W2H7_UNCKA|nr:MAG: Transmembrane protein [candidate division WWE3 bacterium GW2011_GWC2_41_23]KKS10499.1 MAG: Transmembrane protein [candidate division WWE3 bacterium GW2011_GWF2_41_45]KKS20306.1 MAG: Transmembrane protein [candidate division WWE3 bacterium GW2011_GWE1_41_72]KKS28092.1 MAG: hypothetical protein UU86_C0012G0003 [candidate division WWE3 bacterium GW2011_GWC1_42_102]KKS28465.1 MAG: Transmembrane protein [candidate division WWE3 bacterium GW2011_GWD2_42_11]KKS51062.1 MAG: Transmembrane prote